MAKKKSEFNWTMFFITTAAGAAVSGVVAYTVTSALQKRAEEKSQLARLGAGTGTSQ